MPNYGKIAIFVLNTAGIPMIVVESKKQKKEKLERKYPGALFIDVTSRAEDEFVRLSPFYPHGDIPVPFSPGRTSASVEGIWQGLKVFEQADIDTSLFENRKMRGLKRFENKYGRTLGHKKGVDGDPAQLLDIVMARKFIYAPSYRWILENKAQEQVEKIRALSEKGIVVLLDYAKNTNLYVNSPLSHAWLIKAYIEDCYPEPTPSELARTLPEDLSIDNYVGEWITVRQNGLGEIVEIDGYKATVDFWPLKKVISLVADSVEPFRAEGDFTFIRENVRYQKRPAVRELEVVACTNKQVTELTIPESVTINGDSYLVTSIGSVAFAGMPTLHSLSIPSSIRDIAPDAFLMSDNIAQFTKVVYGRDQVTLMVSRDGKWGVLADPRRKVSAVPFEYERIRFCAARLVPQQKNPVYYFLVKQLGRWGLLNKAGRQQAPCIYDELSPVLDNGLLQGFAFRRGEIRGIIDGKGQETIQLEDNVWHTTTSNDISGS